jgi:putative DNA primase/helicase
MSTAAQYDLHALLEQSGAPPRGNSHDCPKCGGRRKITHTDEVFYCHKCKWTGNAITLAKELGVYRRLSSAEYRELCQRRETGHVAARTKLEKRQAHARQVAESVLVKCNPAPDTHPYLVSKSVKAHGAFVHRGRLVIPVRDAKGTLHNLQIITTAGDKEFLAGGRVTGCCFPIGRLRKRLYLVEGFATGATIHEATGQPVAVCLFASNLQHVAEALRREYPTAEMVIAADNDADTPRNPGRTAAITAARRFGLRAVWPTFPAGSGLTDWNDLAQEIGLEGVRAEIEAAESYSDAAGEGGHAEALPNNE